MNYEMYRKTLNENYKCDIQFNNIRSTNHEIFSITCSKIGLSNFENKRYYINDYIFSPWSFQN